MVERIFFSGRWKHRRAALVTREGREGREGERGGREGRRLWWCRRRSRAGREGPVVGRRALPASLCRTSTRTVWSSSPLARPGSPLEVLPALVLEAWPRGLALRPCVEALPCPALPCNVSAPSGCTKRYMLISPKKKQQVPICVPLSNFFLVPPR